MAEFIIRARNGEVGGNGATGNGIASTDVGYQVCESGTVIPTGEWSGNIVDTSQGEYLWTRILHTFTDGTETVAYSVARSGNNGANGMDGLQMQPYTTVAPTADNTTPGVIINVFLDSEPSVKYNGYIYYITE